MRKKNPTTSVFLSNQSSLRELRSRITFLLVALIVFRIGSFIPIPGVNIDILVKLLKQQQGTVFDIFNIFSGGALSRASIFALGIMPYISASIIMQLLTVIYPTWGEMKKEGDTQSIQKINTYTRYITFLLSVIQSMVMAISLPKMPGMQGLVINPSISFYVTAILSLITGTLFLMWLGHQITEYGIGNGTSIIIFSGIISGFPNAVANTFQQSRQGILPLPVLVLAILLVFAVTFFVIFIERGQRRIIVSYPKRQQGRRLYSAQSSHLPLKINIAGVIPAIFASSILLFPVTLVSWLGNITKYEFMKEIAFSFQPGKLLYIVMFTIVITFFCFFYTTLVFNPRDTANNLKRSGGFIPGIRPGEQTAKYIDKIVKRLTLIGALYITFICLIPGIMREWMKVPFYFGGTSLLIVVIVIIDFITQIQSLIMSTRYESILKKSNLRY